MSGLLRSEYGDRAVIEDPDGPGWMDVHVGGLVDADP